MKEIPTNVSESVRRRNPELYGAQDVATIGFKLLATTAHPPKPPNRPKITKPLLNKTEQRCYDMLMDRGYVKVFKQSFTLRLDPPYRSYTPDLAYMRIVGPELVFVEVKGPHRFRRAGIAKAALAAKTYPQFRFELFEWTNCGWKESVLTP